MQTMMVMDVHFGGEASGREYGALMRGGSGLDVPVVIRLRSGRRHRAAVRGDSGGERAPGAAGRHPGANDGRRQGFGSATRGRKPKRKR